MRARIYGIPYAHLKSRGRRAGPREWTAVVVAKTRKWKPVSYACRVDVIFYLPPSKYPSDHPFGMDLDNLLKRFLDALQVTVFRDVPGKDGCVTEVHARKIRVESDGEAGAAVTIRRAKA